MPIEFTPNSKFQEIALSSSKRFIACVGGKRGGKTTVGAAWLINEIGRLHAAGKDGNFLIVVPTFGIWEQATAVKFKELFGQLKWGEWRENKSQFELKWKDAGGEPYKIFIRSADEPNRIEGITALAAWMDEAAMMKDGTWDNVQARLSIDQGRCIMTTTPYSPNWFWREVIARAAIVNGVAQEGDNLEEEMELVRWSSVDNPAFSPKEYERLRRTMSPEQFARDYNGQAVAMEGLVYKVNEDCFVRPFALPPEWKRFAGMDFGQSDPNVIVCVAEKPEVRADPEKGIKHEPSVFYVYREFYKAGALLHEMADFLKQEEMAYTLHDPRGAQEAAELTRFFGCRRILPADNSREVGIERIKGLIHEGRLKFFRGRCDRTIQEVLTYHYPMNNPDKVVKDQPVGINDHAMDALRYAFSREQMDGLYRGLRKPKAARRPMNDFWGDSKASRGPAVDRFTGYSL